MAANTNQPKTVTVPMHFSNANIATAIVTVAGVTLAGKVAGELSWTFIKKAQARIKKLEEEN